VFKLLSSSICNDQAGSVVVS